MSKRVIGYYYQDKQLWKIIRVNKKGFISCYKEFDRYVDEKPGETIRNLPVLDSEGDFLLTTITGKISYLSDEVKQYLEEHQDKEDKEV